MIHKFPKYFSATLFFFCIWILGQNLNLNNLESEVIKNNREGKYKVSQKKLSDILLKDNLSKEEKGNVLFFLASTYRSVGDYPMCIDNLNKAKVIAEQLPDDKLLMRIDYEYAFVYFDNSDFTRCQLAMDHLAAQDYDNPYPEDQSYILMQEGYLFSLNKKFDKAEKKYNDALKIMKSASPCNLPIVYIKLMNMYGKSGNIHKTREIYNESMRISDSCNILKYKILTASEMEKIYKGNNMFGEAYIISSKLDSLRRLENINSTVSEMHITDKVYTEKQQTIKEESDISKRTLVIISLIIFIVIIIIYYYKKTSGIKKDKLRMEETLEKMKQEIDSFSQSDDDIKLLNSQKYFFLDSDQLTERQKELLIHLAEGFSNKEIAEKLFISESTVKYHLKNIYNILEIKDRKDFFLKLNSNS